MQLTNAPSEENKIDGMSWVGFLETDYIQETFHTINNVCAKHNLDTVDFLYKLKKDTELRRSFGVIHGLEEDDFQFLFKDTYFPLPKAVSSSINTARITTNKLLEYNQKSNTLEILEGILYPRGSVNKEIMERLDILCIVYDVTLLQLLEALKAANLSSMDRRNIKISLKTAHKNELRKKIAQFVPDLDRSLCNFYPIK